MEPEPSAYLETSMISYLVSRPSRDLITFGHQEIMREWWENRRGEFQLFVSHIVQEEAEGGDRGEAQKRIQIIADLPFLKLTPEVTELANTYLTRNVIPGKSFRDAFHIAIASIHRIDYLVTWTCRHIAGALARKRITEINLGEGVFLPTICTPEELL